MVLQEQPKAGTTGMGRRARGRGLILPHLILWVHSSGTSGELIQAREHKEKSPGILHRGAQTPAHNPVVDHSPVLQQRRIPILFILFYFIETGFLCVSHNLLCTSLCLGTPRDPAYLSTSTVPGLKARATTAGQICVFLNGCRTSRRLFPDFQKVSETH